MSPLRGLYLTVNNIKDYNNSIPSGFESLKTRLNGMGRADIIIANKSS
jgi:hypothetical protein